MTNPINFADALKAKNEELQSRIRVAIQAMNEGRYGDARRLLETGHASPLMSQSGVIAGKGGAA